MCIFIHAFIKTRTFVSEGSDKEEFIMNKYILHLLDDWDAREQRAMSAPHYKESEGVARDLPQGV